MIRPKVFVWAGVLLVSMPVQGADIAHGRQLHAQECMLCHGTTHYTRDNRIVGSLDRLRVQVERCQEDVAAEWDADQQDDVVNYLNHDFYQFDAPVAVPTDSVIPPVSGAK